MISSIANFATMTSLVPPSDPYFRSIALLENGTLSRFIVGFTHCVTKYPFFLATDVGVCAFPTIIIIVQWSRLVGRPWAVEPETAFIQCTCGSPSPSFRGRQRQSMKHVASLVHADLGCERFRLLLPMSIGTRILCGFASSHADPTVFDSVIARGRKLESKRGKNLSHSTPGSKHHPDLLLRTLDHGA